MNIRSTFINQSVPPKVHANQKPEPTAEATSQADSFQPSEGKSSNFGPRLLGAFAGAIVGGIAGGGGPNGAAAAAGVGAGVATAAGLGPTYVSAVKDGMNGEPLNDFALTSSAIFGGGVVLTSFSAAAGVTGFALEQALPGSGRFVGAAMGALAGATVGIWN